MRRLTALFSKRSSKSDADSSAVSETVQSQRTVQTKDRSSKSKPSFFRSLSKKNASASAHGAAHSSDAKAKRHPMPQLSTAQAPSSSSSSSGGPHTPDDDGSSFLRTANHKKTWIPWLEPSPVAALDIPALNGPISKALPLLPQSRQSNAETEDEDTSADELSESESHHPPKVPPVTFLRVLTTNAIAPPFSPPPTLHLPNRPLYPRSCAILHSSRTKESLLSTMFRNRLLQRVNEGKFSKKDEAFLAAGFQGNRRPPKPPLSLVLDDNAVREPQHIRPYSEGLKRWTARPCFEDRMVLYFPEERSGFITESRIPGSGFGVEALEFTEALESLAGLYESPDDLQDDFTVYVNARFASSPVPLSPSSGSLASASPPASVDSHLVSPAPPPLPQGKAITAQVAPPPQIRNQSYKAAAPSPLRKESHPPPHPPTLSSSPPQLPSSIVSSPLSLETTASSSMSTPTIVLSPGSPEPSSRQPPAKSAPSKPGVRFADDDKEDQVPLGYVLRIKQKREEKARFLEAERQRRLHEEERQKFELERRKQEAERKKWEDERAKWEKERRLVEEERKKRLYAEEVVASRGRRESQRIGSLADSSFVWEGDREKERERRGMEARESYSRPVYDNRPVSSTARRPGSEQSVPMLSTSRNESPGSSRAPSAVGSGSVNGSVRGSSKPASFYSTPPSSATDFHSRERRESKASRPGSESSQRPMLDQSQFTTSFPWNMNPSIPQIPIMPVVPVMPYMMDMPLLPPTPPFMMQQFGHRPQSGQRSHSSSPSPSTRRIPTSQSLERVNQSSKHERRTSGDIADLKRDREAGSSRPQSRQQSYDRRSITSAATTSKQSRSRPPQATQPVTSQQRSPSRPSSYRAPTNLTPATSPSVPHSAPVPVKTSSWSQPGFQNLSRPTSNRRQTMIS